MMMLLASIVSMAANGLSDVWPGSVSFATGSVPAAAKADSPAGLDA